MDFRHGVIAVLALAGLATPAGCGNAQTPPEQTPEQSTAQSTVQAEAPAPAESDLTRAESDLAVRLATADLDERKLRATGPLYRLSLFAAST